MRSSWRLLLRALDEATELGFRRAPFLLAFVPITVASKTLRTPLVAPSLAMLLCAMVQQAVMVAIMVAPPQGSRLTSPAARRISYGLMVVTASAAAVAVQYTAAVQGWLPGAEGTPVLALIINNISFLVFLHLCYVTVVHIGHSYAEVSTYVASVERAAQSLLADRAALLAAQHDALVAEAKEAIEPTLSAIDIASRQRDEGSANPAITHLQSTLDDRLRPMAQRIASDPISIPEVPALTRPRRLAGFPRRMRLRDVIRPEFLYLLPMPAYVVHMGTIYGAAGVPPAIGTALMEFAVVWAFLRFAPARPVSRATVVTLAFVLPIIALIPGALVMFAVVDSVYANQTFVTVYANQLALAPLFSVVLAYVFALYGNLARLRSQARVSEMEVEQARWTLRHELWAAKRAWAYHVHGTVQSLLSATLIALQRTPVDWPRVETLASAAWASLDTRPRGPDCIEAAVADLVLMWSGTCDVRILMEAEVVDALRSQAVLTTVLNEVLKEIVSNAVRHGGSRTVDVTIHARDGSLVVGSVGGGAVPQESIRSVRGMGSALYAEVASEWEIGPSGTHLRIPIA